jgi:hypothetical protein
MANININIIISYAILIIILIILIFRKSFFEPLNNIGETVVFKELCKDCIIFNHHDARSNCDYVCKKNKGVFTSLFDTNTRNCICSKQPELKTMISDKFSYNNIDAYDTCKTECKKIKDYSNFTGNYILNNGKTECECKY